MSKFDCLFVNGDSYSARFSDHPVYADFLAEQLSLPVINKSVVGSNNKRILRSSIEYINELLSNNQTPLVVIGWSFIKRLEVGYYGNNQQILQRIPDKKHNTNYLKTVTLDWLIDTNEMTPDIKSLLHTTDDLYKLLADFYLDLYLFTQFLKLNNIQYMFFSAADNTHCPIDSFPGIENQMFVSSVNKDVNIFKLHNFCIRNWGLENDPDCRTDTGHLSENGHKTFSNFLLDMIR